MSVAFPALAIFLLALPGLILRYFYNTGNWIYPFTRRPLAEEIAYGVIFASLVHVCLLSVLWFFSIGPPVDLTAIVYLLTGNFSDKQILERTAVSLTSHPFALLAYFLVACGVACVAGVVLHQAVREARLDHNEQWKWLFRFDNEWYYMLQAEEPYFVGPRENLEYTLVTATVQHRDKCYLYVGALDRFFFDRNGDLDRLVLTAVYRRELTADTPVEGESWPDSRYVFIRGEYFVLKYADANSLNFDYVLKSQIDAA